MAHPSNKYGIKIKETGGAINQFISSMSKSKGFARASQYEVRIQLPAALHNVQTNWGKQLSLHCDSISMPGHDLKTQTQQYGSQPAREIVTAHGYEGVIQASFYLDVELHEKRIFEMWQELAAGTTFHKANYYDDYAKGTYLEIRQLSSAKAVLAVNFDERSSDLIRGGRKEGYETEAYGHQNNIEVKQDIQVADCTYAIKAEEVYPATIGDIEYAYASSNQIVKVSVGFNYRSWRDISHTLRGFQPIDV